jgi:RNA polymerase sigma-70 factor (ECF subfamily)
VDEKRDEELLAEHLAGKPGAFDALLRRYANELYGFLRRFVGNATAAEDLVQDTFLQLHLAAASFDTSRALKPWLYTIAANKARDYLRSHGRRRELSLDGARPDEDGPVPARNLEAAEAPLVEQYDTEQRKEVVRAVIARMPEHQRLILALGYYQQLPYAEIAEILDIPVGTVKSRLHSAVTRFAKLWYEHTKTASPTEPR